MIKKNLKNGGSLSHISEGVPLEFSQLIRKQMGIESMYVISLLSET